MTIKIPVGRPTGINNFKKSAGDFYYFERCKSGLLMLKENTLLWKTLGNW